MGNTITIQLGGAMECTAATLPVLPDMTDDDIARMGLDEFLQAYGGVSAEVATKFSEMYGQGTSQQDPVINIDLYVELMVTQPRDSALRTLRTSYTIGIDFMESVEETASGVRGGQGKKLVLVTPDCFKRMCMRSKADNGEVVRTYFLRMETLARRYYTALAAKADRNVRQLLRNQRPSRSIFSRSNDVGDIQGYIYIFPVSGRVSNLFRLGSTSDPKRRLREHGSSHADEVRATIVRVHDARKVEQCVSLFLKNSKYSKRKEVYQGTYSHIRDTVLMCARASVAAVLATGASAFEPEILGPENAAP
jgi:hypothetical protein